MFRLIFLVYLLVIAALASAFDDGILYHHGPPHLMNGEAKICLVQEYVRIKIYKESAKVYCRLVLKNEGVETKARIGFPDGNDHDLEKTGLENLTPSLNNFLSCVDGKPVRTRIEKADIEGDGFPFFHVKTVPFARNQTRIVEDWYEVPLDTGATATPKYYVSSFSYVMWSGSSWNGNIGKATVHVDFMTRPLRLPRPSLLSYIGDETNYGRWDKIKNDRVFWSGFTRPKVQGNRLIFQRSSFEPKKEDNIKLVFDPRIPKW